MFNRDVRNTGNTQNNVFSFPSIVNSDDDPADIQDSVEYQERGFTEDRDLFEDEENTDIDKKY